MTNLEALLHRPDFAPVTDDPVTITEDPVVTELKRLGYYSALSRIIQAPYYARLTPEGQAKRLRQAFPTRKDGTHGR
jgi:hypothetical protein